MKEFNGFQNENFEKGVMVEERPEHRGEERPKHMVEERPEHRAEERPKHRVEERHPKKSVDHIHKPLPHVLKPKPHEKLKLNLDNDYEVLLNIFDDEFTADAVIKALKESPVEIQIIAKIIMDLHKKIDEIYGE